MQTSVHSDADAISTDFLSRKRRNISGTSSTESSLVRYPVEENIEGECHESFDVSCDILKFSLQTSKLLGINRELIGNYWVILGELLGN